MAESASNTPAGDDRNLITIDENYLSLSFEDRLAIFWEKNSRTVLLVLSVVVLAIVSKGAFDYFAARRNRAITAEFAAATSTAQLQAFATTYPTTPLAGLAHLRLADESYTAGTFAAAQAEYSAAAKLLGDNPLAVRARFGAAITLLQAGDASASAALQAIANDTKLPSALRAEAAYHLAVLTRDAGQTAEAARWTDLVLSNDATGFWGQRAMQLRESLPLPAAAASAAPAAPAGNFSATK
jgi:hypothetical protein